MSGNPFTDPDRRAIWEALVERDTQAFVTQDWDMVAGDFDSGSFEGIHAHRSSNPDVWTLEYPGLQGYKDAWLAGSAAAAERKFKGLTLKELFDKATTLNHIEIRGDRALAHKKFLASETLEDGSPYQAASQSLYRLRKIGGRWKIIGFVGYLPLEETK